MKPQQQQERPVITLEPPWWRCAHGTEYQSPSGRKPNVCPRTPSCRGDQIQMVTEVEPVFLGKEAQE